MRETLPFSLQQAQIWRARYQTPFYIYDEEGIRACVTRLQRAFSWNPGFPIR